jgi:hypothetical protein
MDTLANIPAKPIRTLGKSLGLDDDLFDTNHGTDL